MCAHLEMEEQENLESGMTLEEARYAALRRFGNVVSVQERSREMWGWNALETLWQDLRFGLRQLRRSPGFTTVAVLTLALGIGANAAIFNVLDAVLLRLLPVQAPKQLVMLTDPNAHGIWFGSESGDRALMAFSEFDYLHDHNDAFSGVFAADSDVPKLEVRIGGSADGQAAETETAHIQLVSGDYFDVLGVAAVAGRTFTREADRARGAAPVAVLSYSYWKERFGLDSAVLARTIRIHETSFAVIGVAPPGFSGTSVGQAPDVWVPLMMQDAVYSGAGFACAHSGYGESIRLAPGYGAAEAGRKPRAGSGRHQCELQPAPRQHLGIANHPAAAQRVSPPKGSPAAW